MTRGLTVKRLPCAFLCLSILVIISITETNSTIRFDKVVVGNHEQSSSEENVKRVSSSRARTASPMIRQKHSQKKFPMMNNRPRRDHQYATYKVPKQHVLVDYGWTPRQMSSFSATNLLGAGSQTPQQGEYSYPAVMAVGGTGGGGSDEDNAVAAGGHSQQGWGWGHSHGHKKKPYKKSEVNSSAVGMLGFLGLLALVQNVLRQMNNNNNNLPNIPNIPTIPGGGALPGGGAIGGGTGGGGGTIGGRKKRSITDSSLEPTSNQLQETTAAIVPYLLRLNEIREGEWALECSSHLVCMLSQAAGRGMTGQNEKQLIKNTLTSVIGEMLAPLVRPHSKEKENLRKLIDHAASVGLKGEKCDDNFKECKM